MITQSLLQLASTVRRTADIEGDSARERHPDAAVYDLVNRGISAFHRVVVAAGGGGRYVAQAAFETNGQTSLYPLPADLAFLVSMMIGPDDFGHTQWILPFDDADRAHLVDVPVNAHRWSTSYRLTGDNIELLPVPSDSKTVTLWYVPDAPTLTSPSDSVDVGLRFDDYISCYAAREVATKDRAWDLADRMTARLAELEPQIRKYVRQRDQNGGAIMRDAWSQRRRNYRRRWA